MIGSEVLLQILIELPRSIATLDLTITEEIHHRQEGLGHEIQADLRVFARPIVAVREVEGVDVPIARRIVVLDDLFTKFVGRADERPSALASLVKSFFICFSSIFLLLIILFVSNYLAPPNENRIMCRIINAHSLQDETLFVKLVCFRIEILHEIAHYPTVCNSTGTDSSLSNCRPMISQTSGSRHHNIR